MISSALEHVAAPCRQDVLAVARSLHERHLIIGTTGNVSCRAGAGMYITPTRMDYAAMSADDLVFVATDGTSDLTDREPSTEAALHTRVYGAREDVGAVLHCHSPHATAWSFLGEPLVPMTEDNAYYDIGTIGTSVPAPAGSEELADVAVAALGKSRAVLLSGHGVLTVGATPRDALIAAEVIEHQAHIAWLLRGSREPQPAVADHEGRRS